MSFGQFNQYGGCRISNNKKIRELFYLGLTCNTCNYSFSFGGNPSIYIYYPLIHSKFIHVGIADVLDSIAIGTSN